MLLHERTIEMSIHIHDHAGDFHAEPSGKETVLASDGRLALVLETIVDRIERIGACVIDETRCHTFEA